MVYVHYLYLGKCRTSSWGGGLFFFLVFQENLSFAMLENSTCDVNTVTLVLRMILACVPCGQNPLEIEGYCVHSREVKT